MEACTGRQSFVYVRQTTQGDFVGLSLLPMSEIPVIAGSNPAPCVATCGQLEQCRDCPPAPRIPTRCSSRCPPELG